MRWTTRIVVAYAVLLASAVSPTRAADLETVRRDITAMLAAMEDEEKEVTYGPIDVKQENDSFLVTVDEMGIHTPKVRMQIGQVTFRLTPEGEDRYRVTDLRWPEIIAARRLNKLYEVRVSFGSRQFSAIWSSSLEAMVEGEMDLSGIEIALVGFEDFAKGSIDRFVGKTTSTEPSPGKLDRHQWGRVDKLALTAGANLFEIASAEGSYDEKGARPKQYRQALKAIDAFIAQAESGQSGMPAESDAPAEPGGAFPVITPVLEQALRDSLLLAPAADMQFDMKGITLTANLTWFSLDDFGFRVRGDQPDQEKISAGLELFAKGIHLSPGMVEEMFPGKDRAAIDPLLPTDIALDVAAEDLPVRAIWNRIIDQIAAEEWGSAPTDFVDAVVTTALQGLMQADSRLKVRSTKLTLRAGEARLESTIQPAPNSPFFASGSATLDIDGLDDLIEAGLALVTDPEEAKKIGAGLDLFRGASRRETMANGAVVDRYSVTVESDGTARLNGKDLSALLRAAQR